jgi:HD-like signal output (HDOD) protein
MGILGINRLKTGMTLASDLCTLEGRVILKAGQPLTEQAIRACMVWGVNEADVREVTAPGCEAEEAAPPLAEPFKKLAVNRFRLNDTRHPAMRALARSFAVRASELLSPEQAESMLAPYHAGNSAPVASRHRDMGDILKNEAELASLPSIFHEISEALSNPCSSAAYVAEIISKDVSLSARLLRLVNTPFYGFPSKIDTLSRAVAIVGTNQLTSLALGITVMSSFDDIPEDQIRMQDFWLQSVTCGTLARLLAIRTDIPGDERFFVAGLLHDVGRLVLLRSQPGMIRTVLKQAHCCGLPLHELEQTCWGWDHGDLGAALLKQWKLPFFIEHQVRHHHAPLRAMRPEEAAVTHVAEVASHAIFPRNNGTPFVPPLSTEAWDMLGISANDLMDIVNQARQQGETIMAAFFDD